MRLLLQLVVSAVSRLAQHGIKPSCPARHADYAGGVDAFLLVY